MCVTRVASVMLQRPCRRGRTARTARWSPRRATRAGTGTRRRGRSAPRARPPTPSRGWAVGSTSCGSSRASRAGCSRRPSACRWCPTECRMMYQSSGATSTSGSSADWAATQSSYPVVADEHRAQRGDLPVEPLHRVGVRLLGHHQRRSGLPHHHRVRVPRACGGTAARGRRPRSPRPGTGRPLRACCPQPPPPGRRAGARPPADRSRPGLRAPTPRPKANVRGPATSAGRSR